MPPAKAPLKRSSSAAQFVRRPGAKEELDAMRTVSNYLRANPDKLRQLAVEMGIHTKGGKLTKAYGGK